MNPDVSVFPSCDSAATVLSLMICVTSDTFCFSIDDGEIALLVMVERLMDESNSVLWR